MFGLAALLTAVLGNISILLATRRSLQPLHGDEQDGVGHCNAHIIFCRDDITLGRA
jgi:hypothetical protein